MPPRRPAECLLTMAASTAAALRAAATDRSSTSSTSRSISTASFRVRWRRAGRRRRCKRRQSVRARTSCSAAIRAARTIWFPPKSTRSTTALRANPRTPPQPSTRRPGGCSPSTAPSRRSPTPRVAADTPRPRPTPGIRRRFPTCKASSARGAATRRTIAGTRRWRSTRSQRATRRRWRRSEILRASRSPRATPSGRARNVTLLGQHGSLTVKGSAFRMAVGPRMLRSLLVLDLQPPLGGSIAVNGGGLGHGVGLCQWGARGMALQNRSARRYPRAVLPANESRLSQPMKAWQRPTTTRCRRNSSRSRPRPSAMRAGLLVLDGPRLDHREFAELPNLLRE